MQDKKRAVIYARYSSDNQREESIEGQLRECQAYLKAKGYVLVGSYIDSALSARTDDRPDFQRMISDSSKRIFDIVLVWKLDRFSRNRLDSLQYRAILKKNGVDLISATENISDGPEGVLLDSLLTGIAEYYSKDLSQKVRRGMTENVINGKVNGGTTTLGYKRENGRYVIDETDANLVRIIFNLYFQGTMTANKIGKYLKEKKLTNSNGKYVTHATVARTLSNRRYIGEYRIGEIVNRSAFPRIIEDELFNQAQGLLKKNSRWNGSHKAPEPYVLTGKLFCAECGEMMISDGGTSATGRNYHYYLCKGTRGKNKHCDMRRYPKEELEVFVMNAANQFLSNEKIIKRLAKALYETQDSKSNELAVLESNETKLENKIRNLMTALEDGDSTIEIVKDRLKELKDELDQTREEILKVKTKNPYLTQEQIEFLIRNQGIYDENSSIEERRKAIGHFVNSVFLDKDEDMMVFFNFLGEKTIINLNELKSSNTVPVGPPR